MDARLGRRRRGGDGAVRVGGPFNEIDPNGRTPRGCRTRWPGMSPMAARLPAAESFGTSASPDRRFALDAVGVSASTRGRTLAWQRARAPGLAVWACGVVHCGRSRVGSAPATRRVTHTRSGRVSVPCSGLVLAVVGAGPAHLAGLIRSLSARARDSSQVCRQVTASRADAAERRRPGPVPAKPASWCTNKRTLLQRPDNGLRDSLHQR